MPQATPKVPSIWRITRTYLAQRESGKLQDILNQIHIHRPGVTQKRLYKRVIEWKQRGLIKPMCHGHIALTQEGRADFTDTNEATGLPAFGRSIPVCPAITQTDPKMNKSGDRRGMVQKSPDHMAKMRAAKTIADKQRRSDARKIHIDRINAQIEAGRLSLSPQGPQEPQKPSEATQPLPSTTRAGKQAASVDMELLAKLLEGHKPGHTIDLPIGIRLKVTIELV